MPDITVDGGELISILKDMRSLLKASDASLEIAKLKVAPKIPENQSKTPLVGGKAVGAPGTNVVVKSVQEDAPGTDMNENSQELSSKEASMLNAAAVPEEPKSLADALEEEDGEKSEEKSEEKKEEEEEPIEKAFPAGHPDGCMCEECKAARSEKEGMGAVEIKSLFKDIRKMVSDYNVLQKKYDTLQKSMVIDIKKSVDKQVASQLRKMGVVAAQPAIRKLDIGADQYVDLQKAQDDLKEKNLAGKPEQLVNDLSKRSFADLAKMREETGDLVKFKGWLPTREMYPDGK